jgi:hypothetical protein
VSLSQPHSFFLAPILGYSATTITQSATATLGSSSGGGASPFDYAVFSDQQLKMYPNDYITGGVHCNSTVDLSGLSGSGGSYFTKGIEDIGGVSYNVSALNNAKTGPFNNNAQSIPIAGTPDPATIATNLYNQALALNHVVTAANWSGPNGTLQPNSGEDWNSSLGYQWTYSNGTFSMSGSNPKLLDGPWYFVGNLILYPGGDGLTVNGAVVVTGQIQLGGSKLLSAGSNGMAFYSLLGSQQYPNPNNQDCIFTSISSGTTSTTTGTFYAPYGTINFNGGVPVIVGSVIGKKVIATNNITVTYDSNNLSNQLLTGTKAPLRAYLTK